MKKNSTALRARATRATPATLALLAAVALLAAPGALASEAKPLPKELPPFGPDRPLPVPTIAQSTLPNGLVVWLVPRPGFPKVSAVLAVRGGTAVDPAGLEGIGELLARTVNEGTAKRTSRQIAEDLQAIGGEMNVRAGDDAVVIASSALATGAARLLDLVADVAQRATFPKEEVELAKGNALQELAAQESTPEFLARKAFASAVYGSHPYHVVAATREVIGRTTPELLKKEYARRFRPDQALLVVVGDLSEAATKTAIDRAFGAWKGEGAPLPETPPSPPARGREIYLVDRPGSVQSTLMVGRPGPKATDPGYYDALVANTIYAGAFGSRLVQNIREEKGYTYSPRGGFNTYREGSLLQTRADVRNEVTGATLLEVFYELDRMAATKPTADELAQAKRYQTGLYLLRNQIQGAVAGTLAANWVNGLPPETLAGFVPKIDAVTAAGVEEAGRKVFLSGTQTVVVVGDATAVRPEVSLFGPVKDLQP